MSSSKVDEVAEGLVEALRKFFFFLTGCGGFCLVPPQVQVNCDIC